MFLTHEQLAAIAKDIKAVHLGIAIQAFGLDATGLSAEAYHQLVVGGYVTSQEVTSWALQSYKLGQSMGWQQFKGDYTTPAITADKIDALWEKAKTNGLPPLSTQQEGSLKFLRERGAQYIVGLGNRIADDCATLAIESESEVRHELKATVAEETAKVIIGKESAKKLASRLGDATGDWTRNLNRIAETELENAHQEGIVSAWAEPLAAGGFRMAKRPAPDACDRCKALYLDGDGNPRVFTEDELRANGTNFKVKAKDWKPVIGTTHPHCHCILILVPPNFGFNAKGQMVPASLLEAA